MPPGRARAQLLAAVGNALQEGIDGGLGRLDELVDQVLAVEGYAVPLPHIGSTVLSSTARFTAIEGRAQAEDPVARASVEPQLRIPPSEAEIVALFAGWREELVTCRKFGPAARNYAVARLAADVGLRINEARMLDLDDVRWELGRFGKLNVRHGKGSRRRGPKPRLVPLINGADRNLRWFIEDVWGHFDADHTRPGAPLFPSERKNRDGSCSRATADVFRRSLAEAAVQHLPTWAGKLTPHVLRHFCASQLYLAGMTLFAIQELLGHTWTGTTARYIHVHGTHVEDAWVAGQQRATDRWKGLAQ